MSLKAQLVLGVSGFDLSRRGDGFLSQRCHVQKKRTMGAAHSRGCFKPAEFSLWASSIDSDDREVSRVLRYGCLLTMPEVRLRSWRNKSVPRSNSTAAGGWK